MNQKQQAPPKMSEQDQWEALFLDHVDEDDSLSLSDLPMEPLHDNREEFKSSEAIEEFEFRTPSGGRSLLPRTEMCAADQVFFKGQLLPLRLSSVGWQDNAGSQYGSSSGLSSSSSRSTSRSQSSSSHSSSCEVLPPRASVRNIFYAYPSPRRPASRRTSIGSARRSTGSAPPGWNVFRLGIAKTPQIELNDLRHRRLRASTDKNKLSCAKNEKKNASSSSIGLGFGCKCGPDAVEPTPIKVAKNNKKEMKEGGAGKLGLKREENMCRGRMIEWLEELSIGKGLIG